MPKERATKKARTLFFQADGGHEKATQGQEMAQAMNSSAHSCSMGLGPPSAYPAPRGLLSLVVEQLPAAPSPRGRRSLPQRTGAGAPTQATGPSGVAWEQVF